MPGSTQAVLRFLGSLSDDQKCNLEKRSVFVDAYMVGTLLSRSIISQNVFTDVFLTSGTGGMGSVEIQKKLASLQPKSHTNSCSEPSDNHVSINLIIDKHEKNVVFAECDHHFVNLLFNFLTYPPGYVVKNLNGRSHITCFDNLYASAISPNMAIHFKNHQSKEYIVNPKLRPSFLLTKKSSGSFIKFQETVSECDYKITPHPNKLGITDKRMRIIDGTDIEGFVCEATYIVTDDLMVTTSLSSAHLIANAKEGVEEVAVNVGKEEVFLLLEAALGSKTVLTDVFLKCGEEATMEF